MKENKERNPRHSSQLGHILSMSFWPHSSGRQKEDKLYHIPFHLGSNRWVSYSVCVCVCVCLSTTHQRDAVGKKAPDRMRPCQDVDDEDLTFFGPHTITTYSVQHTSRSGGLIRLLLWQEEIGHASSSSEDVYCFILLTHKGSHWEV